MNAIVKELNDLSLKMQSERPEDMDTMRKRMGARDQNGSIAIYSYVDISTTADMLFYWEKASLKEDYDLTTVINMVGDWLVFLADRIPRYYRFNNMSALTTRAVEALKASKSREEVNAILQALQHYYAQLNFWIDLEIPWAALGVAYAQAMGDPAPRAE